MQQQYANLYHGSNFVGAANMRYYLYRYHIPDLVYFKSAIRVTVQQIGFKSNRSAADPLYHTGAPIYNAGPGLGEKEKGSWGMSSSEWT